MTLDKKCQSFTKLDPGPSDRDTGGLRPTWASGNADPSPILHKVIIWGLLEHTDCARERVLLMQTSEQKVSVIDAI